MKKIIVILTILSLAGCVSDDPRQGGFFGGVAGLSSGAYDRRIAERNASLTNLQNIQQDLQVDNARLQQQKRFHTNEVNRLNQKIAGLNSGISTLKRQIANLKNNQRVSASAVRNAESRVKKIQSAINGQKQNLSRIQRTSNNSGEIAAIEANIESLKQQLRAESKRAMLMVR